MPRKWSFGLATANEAGHRHFRGIFRGHQTAGVHPVTRDSIQPTLTQCERAPLTRQILIYKWKIRLSWDQKESRWMKLRFCWVHTPFLCPLPWLGCFMSLASCYLCWQPLLPFPNFLEAQLLFTSFKCTRQLIGALCTLKASLILVLFWTTGLPTSLLRMGIPLQLVGPLLHALATSRERSRWRQLSLIVSFPDGWNLWGWGEWSRNTTGREVTCSLYN